MNKTTNKQLSKAHALRKANILSQTTTEDVLSFQYAGSYIINVAKLDYKKDLQWMFIKAIQVASSTDDVRRVLGQLMRRLTERHNGEAMIELETAIDKYLGLCKNKSDVQSILRFFCYDSCARLAKLSNEAYFLKIFARGRDFNE